MNPDIETNDNYDKPSPISLEPLDEPDSAQRNPIQIKRISETPTVNSVYSTSPKESVNEPSQEIAALAETRRTILTRPVHFNVIILGNSGLGKSTFIDAFLDVKFHRVMTPDIFETDRKSHALPLKPTTTLIWHNRACRTENDIILNIDLIDTPGYGSWSSINAWILYIKKFIKSESYSYKEHKKQATRLWDRVDSRIHLCLYFFEGPRVQETDIDILKKLGKYINIIPILSKADSYQSDELLKVKSNIMTALIQNKIPLFDCMTFMRDTNSLITSPLGPCPPFAVISSINLLENSIGEMTYGRAYPWGTWDINNPLHSDFTLLYRSIIGYFAHPAIQKTKEIYRAMIAKHKEKKKLRKDREMLAHRKHEKRAKKMGVIAGLASFVSLAAFAFIKTK